MKVFTYSEKSPFRRIKSFVSETKREPQKVAYVYDDETHTEKLLNFSDDGLLMSTQETQYDAWGNILSRKDVYTEEAQKRYAKMMAEKSITGNFEKLDAVYELEAYKYEYDAQGNWTKRSNSGETKS